MNILVAILVFMFFFFKDFQIFTQTLYKFALEVFPWLQRQFSLIYVN